MIDRGLLSVAMSESAELTGIGPAVSEREHRSVPTRGPATLRPLTERVLASLPGARPVWILAWALVPWANAGANALLGDGRRSAVWEQGRTVVLLNYAALSVAVVLTLWGADRLARRSQALATETSPVFAGDAKHVFRDMSAVAAPLALATATAVAFGLSAFVRDGAAAAALRGATWLVLGVAFWSFLWTYASVHVGLDRLGRERLLPHAAHGDPGLGLRPLGDLAFMGLWMLVASIVPILLTGLPDLVGVVIGGVVLAGGLAAFFLSLAGLHRQMGAVKARELALARNLYSQAYEPVRAEPTLETLERQRSLLAAADALEKRADAIHDWPIDEGTVARVLTIATSVVGITIARLLLDPLGL